MAKDNSPILITGSHRSGTTWVGTILDSSPGTTMIREPFNPGHRPGIFRTEVPNWYLYLDHELGAEYEEPYRSMLEFKYNLPAEIQSLHSFRDAGRMVRDMTEMKLAAMEPDRRAIIKDPLALLSTKWIVETFSARAVILMRHPAAFVSSLKRVGWKLSFQNFLSQPALMDCFSAEICSEIKQAAARPPDLITRGALLWKVLYSFVDNNLAGLQDIQIIRHEDIALNPMGQFDRLFQWLDLEFTEGVRKRITEYSGSQNPGEAKADEVFVLKRDSAGTIETWKKRLTQEEIRIIQSITLPIADKYYSSDEWDQKSSKG